MKIKQRNIIAMNRELSCGAGAVREGTMSVPSDEVWDFGAWCGDEVYGTTGEDLLDWRDEGMIEENSECGGAEGLEGLGTVGSAEGRFGGIPQQGGRGESLSGVRFLDLDEEARMVRQMKEGSIAARDGLFESFRPLAVRIANQCFNQWKHGLELGDLVAWAYIGLMKGLERFDPVRGARVSTCVTPYITKEVYRANANYGRLIRLPVNQTAKLTRYYAFVREFEATKGVLPSMETVASALGIRGERLDHLVSISASIKSLNADLGDPDAGVGGTREEHTSATEEGVLEQIIDRELMDEVFKALEALDERDCLIVKKRFNLDGEGFCTLDAIAEKLDLTKERVRQLEKRALDRLRALVA